MGVLYKALVLEAKRQLRLVEREASTLGVGEVRIRMAAVGICGSDMHYYNTFGNVGHGLNRPLVLGHEASGIVQSVGDGVRMVCPGDKVVVNPLLHCGHCGNCKKGKLSLCEHTIFPGSALTVPHVDGFFREQFDVPEACCIVLPPETDLCIAALADPLACSLHALDNAGGGMGKRVLILGTGSVAAMTVAAARLGGALEVVVGGRNPRALEVCVGMGADASIDISSDTAPFKDSRFDLVVETTGVPDLIAGGMRTLRKGGVLVQIGSPSGEAVALPWALVMEKELRIVGAMRWNSEFDLAVAYILGGRVDPAPILSATYPLDAAEKAFEAAADHHHNMKVQFVS
ncbi:MAG: alcohol dehydrogenase catalytic domain-containing protein [Planctomycetaceae bacterium]|nr:alcohol dehydrogenase catalytic domain-containing protein [Planctomycetaceae bacterium]